ncbi:hypothetical protein U1Q18_005130 [Sarracenia purpurea var. burkii]
MGGYVMGWSYCALMLANVWAGSVQMEWVCVNGLARCKWVVGIVLADYDGHGIDLLVATMHGINANGFLACCYALMCCTLQSFHANAVMVSHANAVIEFFYYGIAWNLCNSAIATTAFLEFCYSSMLLGVQLSTAVATLEFAASLSSSESASS